MKEAVMATATKQNPVIRLWPKTRKKLDRIAKSRSWKLNAAVEALCNDFLSREQKSESANDANDTTSVVAS